jgi:hypothetical protein
VRPADAITSDYRPDIQAFPGIAAVSNCIKRNVWIICRRGPSRNSTERRPTCVRQCRDCEMPSGLITTSPCTAFEHAEAITLAQGPEAAPRLKAKGFEPGGNWVSVDFRRGGMGHPGITPLTSGMVIVRRTRCEQFLSAALSITDDLLHQYHPASCQLRTRALQNTSARPPSASSRS